MHSKKSEISTAETYLAALEADKSGQKKASDTIINYKKK